MSLKEYHKKRNFTKTSEPSGKESVSKKTENRFCIQEHYASHLHYDLRLEIDGVLKSWAIPKKPLRKSLIKRLVVRTEDHPVGYINFQGIIPKGEYGAGRVKIWDQGFFKLENNSAKRPEEGNLVVNFSGKKLLGKYALIYLNQKNWLFFKIKANKKEV